ncbi:UDP-arabinose 4-epimerase [Ranunculus cassubicifolius]
MNPPNDGRFPGGPTTTQIQLDRKAHKCESIWVGNVDYQKPSAQYHGQSQAKMMLETNNDGRRKKLSDIGFGLISSFNWIYTNLPLCFTIAERFWHRSCTFHFPVGEMTITLEDIYNITGLPIVGFPLTCEKLRDYGPIIERCLGKKPDDEESCRTGKIKLEWLKSEFGTLPGNATADEVDYYTWAYLLALCGNCLFPNSTGTYVNAYYLQFLEDLEKRKDYAWGAAVLAYLFKCLTEFVMSKTVTDLRGFAPILQVWSYLHIPSVGRPLVAPNCLSFPLLAKYCTGDKTYLQEPRRSTLIYRQEFDLLSHDKVIWAPYDIWDDQMRLLFSHRSCMIHMKKITPHPVDRCMRQFRYLHDIPGDPIH